MDHIKNKLELMMLGLEVVEQKKRAETQMTLGQLIDNLSKLPKDTLIKGVGECVSYRGYYGDLAFETSGDTRTVADLLKQCQAAMGEIFIGYKGGEFVMGRKTPIWLSDYGTASGLKIIGLTQGEPIEFLTEEEE